MASRSISGWVKKKKTKQKESNKIHLKFMRLALRQAREAARRDEVPVGAVLVREEKIIAQDGNRILEKKDPTAHAEILVLRRAGQYLQNERLVDTILYTTVEPCSMCAGALVLARISQVVFATADPKAGAVGSLLNIANHPQLNHRVSVLSGVLQKESQFLLQRFFKRKRNKVRQRP